MANYSRFLIDKPSINLTPIRKILTTISLISMVISFQFPQIAFAANSEGINLKPLEFESDYSVYAKRKPFKQAIQTKKDVAELQKDRAAYDSNKQRKSQRIAQAMRGGNLRDIPEEYITVKSTFTASLTGYNSTPEQCSGNPFITASGARVHPGTVAASRKYPFGTKFRIPSLDPDQIYTVEDRGGAVNGDHLDIWTESTAQSMQIGRRTAEVEVLSFGAN